MSKSLRIFMMILMLVGLLSFLTAPAAKSASKAPTMVADGSAPIPWCIGVKCQ